MLVLQREKNWQLGLLRKPIFENLHPVPSKPLEKALEKKLSANTHPSGSLMKAMCLIFPSVRRFWNGTLYSSKRSQAAWMLSTTIAICPYPPRGVPPPFPAWYSSPSWDSVPWLCVSSKTPFRLAWIGCIVKRFAISSRSNLLVEHETSSYAPLFLDLWNDHMQGRRAKSHFHLALQNNETGASQSMSYFRRTINEIHSENLVGRVQDAGPSWHLTKRHTSR